MANIVFDFLHNYQRGERRESEPANAYQYDEGHVLEAILPEVITAAEIHYWIRGMEEADAYTPTSITPNSDGSCTVIGNIPNKYFETNGELRIYIVVTDGTASITTYEGKLHIAQRAMPDDYVDDDPENEATRILTEAQAAATTATQQAQAASTSAGQAQQSAETLSGSVAQIATNKNDISTLKEDYTQILDSAYVTDTASGSIASFPDGADGVPVKSLKVNIEPAQSGSGDPSPDNVRPISGHTQAVVTRTGKNLFDPSSADKEWVRLNDTEIITQNTAKSVRVKASQGDTFTLSNSNATSSTNILMLTFLAVDDSIISRNVIANGMTYITQTAPVNTATLLAAFYTWSAVSNAQLELGSAPTSYEPYTGSTISVNLETEAGAVYGGTLDVGTGVLTVDMGTKTITDGTSISRQASESTKFYTTANDMKRCDNYAEDGMLSNRLKTRNRYDVVPDAEQFVSGYPITSTYQGENWIYFSDGVSTSVADIKTWLADNPLQVVYPLAEPFTVQLTANEISTLLGQNNIWSDAGDVEAEYRADTKLYIEKLTAPTEDDMIADHAISANTFFMIGNTLYRATTAIASGATITVGTNATKLSLSDALNALA